MYPIVRDCPRLTAPVRSVTPAAHRIPKVDVEGSSPFARSRMRGLDGAQEQQWTQLTLRRVAPVSATSCFLSCSALHPAEGSCCSPRDCRSPCLPRTLPIQFGSFGIMQCC